VLLEQLEQLEQSLYLESLYKHVTPIL